VLEHLRLLTNLETNKNKLLQIVLLGQPELRDRVSRHDLEQLRQRIIARYHLGPLSRSEVPAYVQHRLAVAGCSSALFSASALNRLYRLSGGIPRMINLICDRAMLGAFAEGLPAVDRKTLENAAREVSGVVRNDRRVLRWAIAGLLVATVGAVFSSGILSNAWLRDAVTVAVSPVKSEIPAVPAARPEPSLAQFEGISGDEGRISAFMAMLGEWKVQGAAADPEKTCEQLNVHGLQCVKTRGNMETLRKMDRPSVLRLTGDNGVDAYVTLISLSDGSANCLTAGIVRTIALPELESRWTGDFIAIQRMEPEFEGAMSNGDSGSAVAWLDGQLSRIRGRQPRWDNNVFDDSIEKEVREYQRKQGLVPDGVVGQKTMLKIQESIRRLDPVLQTGERGT
jgi:general secretion pathway protein A